MGGIRLTTIRLTTSHSQRLNNGKPLGTGCCEWLVVNCNVGKRDTPQKNDPVDQNYKHRPSNELDYGYCTIKSFYCTQKYCQLQMNLKIIFTFSISL